MTTAYAALQSRLETEQHEWLITGVAGFIGSALLERLLKLNQRVRGLDNFLTGRRENLADARSRVTADQWNRFTMIEGDIRSAGDCAEACRGAEFVLHQAALGSVPRSLVDPRLTHDCNITGFLEILLAARDAKVGRLVYAASSSTYGDSQVLPKREETIGRPLSPYAVTKYVNELYADVFARSYGLNSVGLRYFNVFGRRQDPSGAYAAVIPLWFASLLAGKPVYVNGNGETSRDFCHVDNAVQANLLAACTDSTTGSRVYNVAVGEQTTLTELYGLIRDEIRLTKPLALPEQPTYRAFRDGDIMHSLADISRIKNELGYAPTATVRVGLREAAEWYLSNRRD